jgi:cytochrome bd-type quinol oxidase subunit 2
MIKATFALELALNSLIFVVLALVYYFLKEEKKQRIMIHVISFNGGFMLTLAFGLLLGGYTNAYHIY